MVTANPYAGETHRNLCIIRANPTNDPAASSGVLAVFCHVGLDPASSSVLLWIPVSAGMTNSRFNNDLLPLF
jgi:hypothetical protein